MESVPLQEIALVDGAELKVYSLVVVGFFSCGFGLRSAAR
jgi:hypothetical protein